MPRLIKFRAWDSNRGRMSPDGGFIQIMGHGEFVVFNEDSCEWEIEGHILMQYTGLKDKNGVEVYQSDCIRHSRLRQGSTWEVIWLDDACGWFIDGGGQNVALSRLCEPLIEVIGNIYSNPELVG